MTQKSQFTDSTFIQKIEQDVKDGLWKNREAFARQGLTRLIESYYLGWSSPSF